MPDPPSSDVMASPLVRASYRHAFLLLSQFDLASGQLQYHPSHVRAEAVTEVVSAPLLVPQRPSR
ncbi:hypothetical protein PAXRUDRAFT_824880 [Paxillus rubicundulus Ve08.2h10]|uniref:Uncharacterized protein n=1 Tax=Paxillus rubicundulus Ve08.2h10 TaxID=930991 RepID=A0A0D0DH85_9AGAM|nr:hypothetical protein PAXRUDRAFT_824880 [Paxillus rubicundulus Ve08.2h10]